MSPLLLPRQTGIVGGQPILNRGSGLVQDIRFLARLTMPVGQGWDCMVSGVPVGGATSTAGIHYNGNVGIGAVASGTGYQADDPRLGPCYTTRGSGSAKGLSWPGNGGSGSDDPGGRALRLSGNTGTFLVRHAVAYLSADDIVFCHPHNDGATWAQPYVTWAMKRHASDYRGQLFLATSGGTSTSVSSSSAFWDATSSDFSPFRWRTYAIVRNGDSVRFLRFAHQELGSGTVTELDETASGAGTQDWVYRDSPECGIYLQSTKYWSDNGTGFTSLCAVWDRPLDLAELAQIHATPEALWTPTVPAIRLTRQAASGPTTQYRSISGAAAPAASVLKRTSKVAGGTIGPTATLAALKAVLRSFAGATTPTSSQTRRTAKTVAGTATSAGTVTALRSFLRTLTGTVAATGGLVRRTSRTMSGTAATSSTLSVLKAILRMFAGTTSAAGAVVKQPRTTVAGFDHGARVVALQPTAFWRLGEPSGTTMADSSGNARHGTFYNTPALGAPGAPRSGGDTAVSFAAASFEYGARSPYDTDLNPPAVTVSVWLRRDDNGVYNYVLDSRGGPNKGYGLRLTPAGVLEWLVGDGAAYQVVTGPTIPDATWTHVVATATATTQTVYVDGVLAASGSWAYTPNLTSAFTIAADVGGGWTWSGTLDDVALFNRELQAPEIAALYDSRINTLRPAGTAAKRPAKTFAGTVPPGGTLQAIKAVLRSLAAALSPSGSLARRTNKTAAATTSPSSTVTRRSSKAVAGAASPSSTLSTVRTFLRTIAGTVTAAASLRRQPNKTTTGTAPPTSTVTKRTAKTVAGASVPTGSTVKVAARTLGGTLAAAAALASQFIAGGGGAVNRTWQIVMRGGKWRTGQPGSKWRSGGPQE